MKCVSASVVVVAIVACGVSYGQETPSNYEHLKCYDQLIGTWVYEGQALEDVPEILEKGADIVIRESYKWILDKNAIEVGFYAEIKGGDKISAKSLIGWDLAEEKIVRGGMNSKGGHSLATIVYDDAAKTWTAINSGVNREGKTTSSTVVLTLENKDTYVSQGLNRKGGFTEGDGPKYVFKRLKRPKQPKLLEEAK